MNNYKAVNQAEIFRERLMKPIEEQIKIARQTIGDSTYPWTSEKQKEAAIAKKKVLEETFEQYQQMYDAVYELARDHENAFNELIRLYTVWHQQVSYEGQQQKEMMQSQADVLQETFRSIFKLINVINTDKNLLIKPPK